MRIGHRMYLALVPAVLGVLTVAGLAYWGRYAHAAPEWLIVVAVVASVTSLGAAWASMRHVVRRVESLAAPGAADELAAIESTVHHLSSAIGEAEAARAADQTASRAKQRASAELLGAAARGALRQLDEIRLPLHILLENHFGDLNENQEEMLGAARAAAEQAGDAFQRLSEIADVDRGAMQLRRDRVRAADLVAGVLPALVAEGQQRGVHVHAEVAPAIQSIVGDRARLQLALELLLRDALRRTGEHGDLPITVEADGSHVTIVAQHGDGDGDPLGVALGARLIEAQGGDVSYSPRSTMAGSTSPARRAGNQLEIKLIAPRKANIPM